MLSAAAPGIRKRVLIIEPQALFGTYFAAVIAAGGHDVLGVKASPRCAGLRRLRPDIVVLDASYLDAPLRWIRALRCRLTEAHLIVYTPRANDTWPLLARGLGADVVIGPRADEPELLAALAALAA